MGAFTSVPVGRGRFASLPSMLTPLTAFSGDLLEETENGKCQIYTLGEKREIIIKKQ